MLRTLDVDPINRRAAFAHVLSEFPCMALTQAQREEAIGRGLRDREEGVKKAAKRLACKWVEDPRVGGLVNVSSRFIRNTTSNRKLTSTTAYTVC